MTNNYITHVKAFMEKEGITNYKQGMIQAKTSYVKKSAAPKQPKPEPQIIEEVPVVKKAPQKDNNKIVLAFDDHNVIEDFPIVLGKQAKVKTPRSKKDPSLIKEIKVTKGKRVLSFTDSNGAVGGSINQTIKSESVGAPGSSKKTTRSNVLTDQELVQLFDEL